MVIYIRLREKGTNSPITWTMVHISGENGHWSDSTDGKGYAIFPDHGRFGIKAGKYVVKVRSPKHRPYTKTVHLKPNSTISISLDSAII